VVCVALVATVAYGRWRVGQSDGFIEPGPLVAAVQSNVPQSVKQSFQASDAIFDELLHHSSAAAEAGAGLIVWPETMVQAILEPQVLRLLDSSHPYRIFDKAIREHSNQTAFVLVGAYGGTPQIQENFDIRLAEKYNSAFLYGNDGSQAYEQYSKIHLVPFGEFVPFKNSSPLLYNLLMRLTPYDYDYSLDAGKEYTVFKMAGDGQVYSFSVMICYEDAVPAIARRFTLNGQGQKRIDWLVNISNDGWFVRFKNGRVFPSTELAQHTAVCVFRAVENRLAVLRSVNTGISCLIDTVGRIKNGFLAGDLPNKAMDRTGCAGWFVDRVPLDKRTTFFSKYGQWLDFSCAGCLVLFIIVPPLGRSFRTEKIRNLFAGMPK
jgi:apolipoprotein N-acyltransferase